MGNILYNAARKISRIIPSWAILSAHSIFSRGNVNGRVSMLKQPSTGAGGNILEIPCTYPWSSDKDTWAEISKFLDAKSLVMLAATDRWFHRATMEDDYIWKLACLRDLHVPTSPGAAFKWSKLYTSAFDGSHCYKFRQQEIKRFDDVWGRIGAFSFDSSDAVLPYRLDIPPNMIWFKGLCWIQNVKPGIWILDMHAVECYDCDDDPCGEVMHILDVRHIELFLCEDYVNGSWEYQLVTAHVQTGANVALGVIIDLKHLEDSSIAGLFGDREWNFPKNVMTFPHAVAVCTDIFDANEGLYMKYYAMRAGTNGEVVSIRITQRLLSSYDSSLSDLD